MSFDLPSLPLHEPGALFTVLAAAMLLAPPIARRVRVPDIIILVLFGFAIGPTGLGLVERVGVVEVLGGVGLLYLMFVAGLELDLDDFVQQRGRAIGYGGALFFVPMIIGTLAALALDYSLLAALLIGSCWSSHTLLTYPIFQRAGAVGNRAVSTTVGATIVTDTAALLVLAVVARAYQGELGVLFWATLVPSALLLTAAATIGLPRLARRFFSGEGQDRNLRFLFVLVVLFLFATLFEIIGIEAIVGAFLAGLALNRSVPNGGALMERIDFLGATLFIPLFLLATGMLVDLRVLTDPRTLLIGAVFTAVAMGCRLLASYIAGRAFRWGWIEIWAMFSISAPQAAATLAVMTVGLNIGLIDTDTVNAAVLVILVSCLLSSSVATRVAGRLPRPEEERDLGELVAVPLANPATAPRLMRLASAFARADGGLVVPVLVSPPESDTTDLDQLRALDGQMTAVAQSQGAEARSVLRIDTTPQIGIVHTIAEQRASLLVLGWKGMTVSRGARFGGIIDGVLARTDVPTLLTYEGDVVTKRILVVVDESVATPRGREPLRLALATARHLTRELDAPIEVVANVEDTTVAGMVRTQLGITVELDRRRRSIVVKERARPSDLVVLPTLADDAHLRGVTARVLRAVPEGASLLVAIAEAAPAGRAEARAREAGSAVTTAGDIVGGRRDGGPDGDGPRSS